MSALSAAAAGTAMSPALAAAVYAAMNVASATGIVFANKSGAPRRYSSLYSGR